MRQILLCLPHKPPESLKKKIKTVPRTVIENSIGIPFPNLFISEYLFIGIQRKSYGSPNHLPVATALGSEKDAITVKYNGYTVINKMNSIKNTVADIEYPYFFLLFHNHLTIIRFP